MSLRFARLARAAVSPFRNARLLELGSHSHVWIHHWELIRCVDLQALSKADLNSAYRCIFAPYLRVRKKKKTKKGETNKQKRLLFKKKLYISIFLWLLFQRTLWQMHKYSITLYCFHIENWECWR